MNNTSIFKNHHSKTYVEETNGICCEDVKIKVGIFFIENILQPLRSLLNGNNSSIII